ncbi:MAG: efflux RND transporter periplasmic adaptor subunit [Desulfobacterales bacterium]|nr:efflux RND transporter periplasmic adaptor subunit [Desulfobacterales bacterium]
MRSIDYYLKFVVIALLWVIPMSACSRSESKAQSEEARKEAENRIVHVSVVKVEPGVMRDILVLPGETEAWQDVRVPADTGGLVDWIGPREGDAVRKGELLAKIDVSTLKANLDKAEAAAKLADELYQRRKTLFEGKILTKEDLDRSQTERTLAYGNLKQAQVEYERGSPVAPISGFVNHLYVDEGEFIERGKPMLDLVNVDKIKVNANVPELDVKYLKVGQKTTVRMDAFPDRKIQGVVDFVAYKADPATKTFLVKVIVDNQDHAIRPGMIARVAFLRQVIPDALTAPLFALTDKGGERLLFVEKEGVVQARSVSIGIIEGDRIQITKGLNPGDHLIVAGQSEVEEGMRVRVQ